VKFIKINDDLLEKINQGEITEIAIVNDKDDISLDDTLEFFNSENVAFGRATINQISIRKLGDLETNKELIQYLISEYDTVTLSASDHVKVMNFEYERYQEPKSISTDTSLDTTSLKIYSDGGSRGNPGPSASGYVILTEDDELIKANGVYLGITTNNQAEYKSIKFALQDALELGGKYIAVFMDSLLVINQLKGTFKIKNEALYPIYRDIKELVTQFEGVTFTHVPREFNKLADAEVNKCLDEELNIT
jgi:ribonuclease HI